MVLKEEEEHILYTLNEYGVDLELDAYKYNRFDAYNEHYIVEFKHRKSYYKDVLIEFDKFSYNLLYAEMNNKYFIYAVRMEYHIYIFNITKLAKQYDFRWEWKEMPKQTEFGHKEKIKKLVGYININKSAKEYNIL